VITLPVRSEVSLAATTPCQKQLCTVLGSSADKLSVPCKTLRVVSEPWN